MKKLTKTDFILYQDCHQNVWIKWNMLEEYGKFEVSEFEKSLGEMGQEVEEVARLKFSDGYLIDKRSEGAQELTKQLMVEHKPVIFQAVFSTKKYLAATDVLKWNEEAGMYDLYEIKMSSAEGEVEDSEEEGEESENKPPKVNRKKETQYENDIGFQVNVAKLCGVDFNKKYLIRLNKRYIRIGDIDINKLFEITDKTEIINDDYQDSILTEMEMAYDYLSGKNMKLEHCSCYYKGRSSHCTTFSISNPDATGYTVHDLNRIGNSKRYLKELLDEGILRIDQVPEDERLMPKKGKDGKTGKPTKLNQVRVYKTKEEIKDIDAIKRELNSLEFPLYFLDYETNPTAIPPFNGYHPYQHIVFQYSLHILRSKDSELEHEECLILDGDPAERIVESLRKNIGDTGSVISWYKKFENSRNKELARLVPLQHDFLHSVVARTYDLMDIVDNQYYVHYGFKGSSSIKKIQPVIAPDFSYKELDVQNGTAAIEAYRQISGGKLTGKDAEEKSKQMLKYCEYDTKIMYIIWKFFVDLVEKEGEK
ncbi:MAG: DUF2779 domain-containing protein [Candidatus Paceibacterota bacterium]